MSPSEAATQALSLIFQDVKDAITSFISNDALIVVSAIISILLIIKGYHIIKDIMLSVDRRDDDKSDDTDEEDVRRSI